jgi:hypothetical protein
MGRKCLACFSVLSFVGFSWTGPCLAGGNAGGRAWLSWDQGGTATDHPGFSPGTIPLFLHIADAPDIQVLAVDLRWFPNYPAEMCYTVIPAVTDTSCGWATLDAPSGGFEGDATYTWRIQFPPLNPSRACVAYSISSAGCPAATPADFVLASVKVKDSDGAVDSLAVSNGATILGGSEKAVSVTLAEPQVVSPGMPATVRIQGLNLSSQASLSLEGAHAQAPATSVEAPDTTQLIADVYVPNTPGETFDVVVRRWAPRPSSRRFDCRRGAGCGARIAEVLSAYKQ